MQFPRMEQDTSTPKGAAPAHVGAQEKIRTDGPLKILVAEDDADIRLMMRMLLGMKGYRVVEARDGQETVDVAKQERPDLILVDLSLPKIDGWEMIRRMQEDDATKDIPIIVVSARRPQDEAARAAMAQVAAYISKPFDPEALMTLVQQTIHNR